MGAGSWRCRGDFGSGRFGSRLGDFFGSGVDAGFDAFLVAGADLGDGESGGSSITPVTTQTVPAPRPLRQKPRTAPSVAMRPPPVPVLICVAVTTSVPERRWNQA